MDAGLPTNFSETGFGGAALFPLTHQPAPPAQLVKPAPAPPRVQFRQGLVSQPRPAVEVMRRPANNGVRAVISETPDRVAPGQTPRAMYAAPITADAAVSWLDDCECP